MLIASRFRKPVVTAFLAVATVLVSVAPSSAASSLSLPTPDPDPLPAPDSGDAPPNIRGTDSGAAIPGQYIVVLKDTASVQPQGLAAAADVLAGAYGGTVGYVFDGVLNGFSVAMTEQDALRLAANPDIDHITQDQIVHVTDTQPSPPSYGLDRIDQHARPLDHSYSYGSAKGVTAFVLDSGIRITHTDFGGRARDGYDFVDNDTVAQDCLGHGTHTAGIIGGKTYGVAKDVDLVAVRVLDCTGNGPLSRIIQGVKFITADAAHLKPAVANASIGVTCYKDQAHTIPAPCPPDVAADVNAAITASIDTGVAWVVSAGNNNLDACNQPIAGVGLAITVANTDIFDARASDSNFGPCINIFAPGGGVAPAHTGFCVPATPGYAGIWSAGIASDTATCQLSGTSMAAPHVAGAVALILGRPGWAAVKPPQVTGELVNHMSTPGVVTNLPVAPNLPTTNRLLYTAPPPVAGGSPIAVARRSDGRLELFDIGGGKVIHRIQTSKNGSGWDAFTDLDTNVDADFAVLAADTNADGRAQLASVRSGVDNRDQIFVRSRTGSNVEDWNPWGPVDGLLNSVAMARNANGKMELFGTNDAGQAFHRSQSNASSLSWAAWDPAPFGLHSGIPLRSIAAETNGEGRIEAFALTNTGEIWHRWQTVVNSNSWSGWVRLTGSLTSISVAREANGRLLLFGANSAGTLFTRQQAAGMNNWLSWSELIQAPGAFRAVAVAVDTNDDGRVELFAVSDLGIVLHAAETGVNTSRFGDFLFLGAPS